MCANVFRHFIRNSPGTRRRKNTVRRLVNARLLSARAATDTHQIYQFPRQATGIVNSLYPEIERGPLVIHHEQRVAEYPDTFIETRRGRIQITRAIQTQIENWAQQLTNQLDTGPTAEEDRETQKLYS